MSTLPKTTGLSTIALMLLITGAVDNIRNLPATALFGSSLIFFFIFSAIVFLIPTALVSAELSSIHPDKSGIYHWTKLAFGEKMALLAVWLQWINTMVWFPTILSFIAGTATYAINPELAQNKLYLVSIILSLFWLITFVNFKGIKMSARFSYFCALFGMVVPIVLIISLGLFWVILGKPLQIHLTPSNLVPTLGYSGNWISLTAIMTSFLGVELATVHINDVKDPHKTYPKALCLSAILILVTMILGALAIAFVLPKNKINLVNGVMQAFTDFFTVYHIAWMIPLITIMLLLGSVGGMISWIISPAKGLLQAAQSGFLPKVFAKENQHGVAKNLLIIQAIVVTFMCLAFLFMPSVNGSYWLLTALSTQLYMLMYVLMFVSALLVHKRKTHVPTISIIPGGLWGKIIVCLLGLVGTAITLIVGFIPPDGINVGSLFHYEMIFSLGLIGMILPVGLFYFYRKKTRNIEVTSSPNDLIGDLQ